MVINFTPLCILSENFKEISLKKFQQINDFGFFSTEDRSLDKDKLFSMENNNNAIFTAFLKLAIDSDRSERLNEMIKTTGFQLYNTFIGGNNPVADN